jgi:hypothetical protein
MENISTSRPLVNEELELQEVSRNSEAGLNNVELDTGGAETRHVSQLPPVDGGRKAWSLILGGIMIEGLGWGELSVIF